MIDFSDAAVFRRAACQALEHPYVWGAETPGVGFDCSGTVCYALTRIGYKIRTTADALYQRVFTRPVDGEAAELDASRILAVFYIAEKVWEKLDGTPMPPGTARHVAPVVGRYVVLHADWGANRIYPAPAAYVRQVYEGIGCRAVWRELDPAAARAISDAGTEWFGPDAGLGKGA